VSAGGVAVERLLIVGFGYAGQRFLRVTTYLAGRGLPLQLVGVCDRVAAHLPEGVPGFTDLPTALASTSPTVVVVTVNEDQHANVYHHLRTHRRMLVVSEKPLTTDLASAQAAARSLSGHMFAMNLVERYSPTVGACANWLTGNGPIQLLRVESWWGKHRLGDARPTFGVLSELVHPLDLIAYLLPAHDISVAAALGVRSDFSPHGSDILESVTLQGHVGLAPMLVHGSFALPQRQRQVSLLLRGRDRLYRCDLQLDMPHWDTDRLSVTTISRSGHIEEILRAQTATDEVPDDIRGVAKVATFLERAIAAWRGDADGGDLVDLAAALRLQRLLADIDAAAGRASIAASYGYFDSPHNPQARRRISSGDLNSDHPATQQRCDMRKILVTGGAGFIGRYVTEELATRGYVPVVFDHRRHNDAGYPPQTEFFLGDMRDEVAVAQAAAHVDGWIHLAAVLGTQETINNPRPAAVSNLLGGLNMLEASAQYKLPGVYICVGNHWMNNTYSITKTAIERFVCMYNKDRGTHINMVRAVNAYGPRQVAATPFGPAKVRKITPAFACRALSHQPIEVYGDGLQVSDMVYVADLATALVRALELAQERQIFPQAIEVGPEDHHTVMEVARLVNRLAAQHTGSQVEIVNLPMRPGETPGDRVVADTSTLKVLGLDAAAFVQLEEGMERTVRYYADSMGQAWQPAGAER
jgi:UDP-glucose 4-epimerase